VGVGGDLRAVLLVGAVLGSRSVWIGFLFFLRFANAGIVLVRGATRGAARMEATRGERVTEKDLAKRDWLSCCAYQSVNGVFGIYSVTRRPWQSFSFGFITTLSNDRVRKIGSHVRTGPVRMLWSVPWERLGVLRKNPKLDPLRRVFFCAASRAVRFRRNLLVGFCCVAFNGARGISALIDRFGEGYLHSL
jgi:hypothetical protein